MSPFLDLLANFFFGCKTLSDTLDITAHYPISIIIPDESSRGCTLVHLVFGAISRESAKKLLIKC